MMSGMYAAISGLNAHQTLLDVTADNLANVDTVGYKRQSAVFSDELAELIAAGGPANGYSAGTNPVQVGLGVQVGAQFECGAPTATAKSKWSGPRRQHKSQG